MNQVEGESQAAYAIGHIQATEDVIDICDREDNPSGIYTFEDAADDSFMKGSTTIDEVKADQFSSASRIVAGTLVSTKSTQSDEKMNVHTPLSLPTGQVEESPSRNSLDYTTRTEHIPTPPSLVEIEEGRGFVLNVNVPDDGSSLVSSLASVGELSFMPLRMSPFSLEHNGEGYSLGVTEKDATMKQEAEAFSILSGTYESIIDRFQNRDDDRPIQSYRSVALNKTASVEKQVSGPVHQYANDDQSGKVTAAKTPDGTDKNSSVNLTSSGNVNVTSGTKTVARRRSYSSTSRDDSIATKSNFVLSQKLKYHDVSDGLLLSTAFRRLVCCFGILILLCILVAVVGTVLTRKDEVSSQSSLDADVFFHVKSTQINPPDELDTSLASTIETIAVETNGTLSTPPMSQDFATGTTNTLPTIAVSPTSETVPRQFKMYCKDDPDFSFTVSHTNRTCQWLSVQPESEKSKLCDPGNTANHFRNACRLTCDNCPLHL